MTDRRVFKYPVPIADAFALELPEGAEVLAVQVQHGQPCIWALVNTRVRSAPRHFRLARTGQVVGEVTRHVGSFQTLGSAKMFHLFEVANG